LKARETPTVNDANLLLAGVPHETAQTAAPAITAGFLIMISTSTTSINYSYTIELLVSHLVLL